MATQEEIDRLSAGVKKAVAQGDIETAKKLGQVLREATGTGSLEPQETQQPIDQGQKEVSGIRSFVTGEGRKVDGIQEIDADQVFGNPFWGDHPSENFQVSAGTLMTFDDEAKKNIWDKQLQAAGIDYRWDRDPHGNTILVYNDHDGTEQIGYLNKPGVSMSDTATTVAQVGSYLGAGKVARGLPWLGNTIAQANAFQRALLAGAGAGTQSLASDTGANALGADISAPDMAKNATVATLAGTALQPIGELVGMGVQSGANALSGLFRRIAGEGPGAIVATRDLVLQGAGEYRPMLEQASGDFWEAVHQQARNAQSPEEAVQAAMEQALRDNIPGFTPLRPHVTGQPADFALLDRVTRGGYGGQPQNELRVIQKENEAALADRARTIREQITGQSMDSVDQAGSQVRQGLRDAYDASKAGVNEAYDKASQLQGQFRAEGVQQLPGRFEKALESGAHKLPGRALMKENYPATTEMLDAANSLQGGDVPIQQFEQMRRYLQGLWKGAQSSDRAAAASILREFDQWGDDMLDQAMYAGDDAAMEALKEARSANRQHMTTFGKSDTFRDGRNFSDRAGKVIGDIIHEDLSPTAVINHIAGSSKLGQTKDSLVVLERVRKAVGDDSQAWASLQEAGLLRLFYDDAGRMRPTGQILKRWDQMSQGDARPWAMRLYGPSNMTQMDNLMKLIARTQRDNRDYVPSGPAIDNLTGIITNMAGRMGISAKFPIVGGVVNDLVAGVRQSGAASRMAAEGQQVIHPPALRYIPEVNFSRAVGYGLAGTGSAEARDAAN